MKLSNVYLHMKRNRPLDTKQTQALRLRRMPQGHKGETETAIVKQRVRERGGNVGRESRESERKRQQTKQH